MRMIIRILLVGLVLVGLSPVRAGAAQPPTSAQAEAQKFKQRYVALVNSWAKGIEFTPDENAAMLAGRAIEDELMRGPDDPVTKRILQAGQPTYAALAALYPGKILDRAILGTWSDPTKPIGPYNNEFSIYWNGAIAADLKQQRHNTVVEFRVGKERELPGRVRARYSSLGYERGYLPIVTATYTTGGVRYAQAAFAAKPDGQSDGWDVAFVVFEATNVSQEPQQASIEARVSLMDDGLIGFNDSYVTNPVGAVLLSADEIAKFDKGALTWKFDLAPGRSKRAVCKIPYVPDAKRLLKRATEAELVEEYQRAVAFWQGLLDKGAHVRTPDARVNDVWRALLLQNFVLADGPRFTYGSGLEYNDSTYPYENGFGAHVFAMYGHGEYADALQEWFIKMCVTPQGAGRKYQNRRAMVMHHLLENYRFTGLKDLWERHRDDYLRIADEIIADRRTTMVEENGERPMHWGLLPPDKPGVDVQASTQRVYVIAHSITNCQGLADLGRFLVITGIDAERGQRYLKEAAEFRECILTAMKRAAIRLPGRPPFVDLQTLYFKETPDYGPEPYDDLGPAGRLQGTYYHYWVDMQLHFSFFNPDDEPAHWLTHYVQQRNGFVLGLCRARTQRGSGGWVNNVYDGGYYNYRLRCGDIDEFLLGFYSKLAFGMSRYTYVASEGSPMVGYNTADGGFVGADYSLPNSAANADTLLMLRNALVMEELKDNVETGTLCLMKGAPHAWLQEKQNTTVERMPTYFGPVSFTADRAGDLLLVTIEPPPGKWERIELSLHHPLKRVAVNGKAHENFDAEKGRVLIPHQDGRIVIEAWTAITP